MSFDAPDVIIVGGGAGGSTAAYALAKRGFTVTVLDKCQTYQAEDFTPFDELHFASFGALTPSPVTDPDVYVGHSGKPRKVNRWWVGNMVGGASMIWESNLIRFTKEDFQVRSLFDTPPAGSSLQDWPWSYETFEPYFERAEDEWGVSGKAGQTSSQEPFRAGYEYPTPPLAPHPSTQFLQDTFARAGMSPYLGPKGINSMDRDDCPECMFCGFCQGYGCSITDRAGSNSRVLNKAVETGKCELRENHCVTRVDHENGVVKGVYYKTDPDGPEHHMTAPLVIVAVQAIQSAQPYWALPHVSYQGCFRSLVSGSRALEFGPRLCAALGPGWTEDSLSIATHIGQFTAARSLHD
ncbi:MAG: GMC family oxidoreductase [Magnetovibrio sp.]|nr:GMC family oxidoreductase [Magnetovibrio sp.]